FAICNCVLNLLVCYPQNVQQIGRFAFGAPRCRLLSLVFAHNLKWNVYLACPSSDLALRRIHELQEDCCSFGNRRRAGVCAASTTYPAESVESRETCENCAGGASGHSGGHRQND